MKVTAWFILAGGAVAAALLAGSLGLLRTPAESSDDVRATIAGLQRDAQTERFARALTPRTFDFPADHGPHDDFQTEWWYYTGNLFDAQGNHFGYQLTFFRRALLPPDEVVPAADSPFAFRQVYFAHFALTDSARGEHVAFERYSRNAADLAGAQGAPFAVFVENWSAVGVEGDAEHVRLRAAQDGFEIDLVLRNTKPIVLHGERGLSQKSQRPGNASYYYSMTRMETRGVIRTPRGEFTVSGNSWLDREWFTSALDDDVAGWDWLSIQLDNNEEVMFFKLRHQDTGETTFAKGTWVSADGTTALLRGDEVQLEPLERWRSPYTGSVYPVRWRVRIPSRAFDVTISARFPDQEMRLSQRYWEGAIVVEGTHRGLGYLEMTGY